MLMNWTGINIYIHTHTTMLLWMQVLANLYTGIKKRYWRVYLQFSSKKGKTA